MADTSYAQSNTYFSPQGIPGYYGNDQSHPASSSLPPYNPADYQPQPSSYQPPTQSGTSSQGAAAEYYGGSIPEPSQISSLPEQSQLDGQEGEGERGLGSMVNKVAGMMGVETSEDDGTMKTLMHMGKKAYKTYKNAKSGYSSYEHGQTAADTVEYMQGGDPAAGGDAGAWGDLGASMGEWAGGDGGDGGGEAADAAAGFDWGSLGF